MEAVIKIGAYALVVLAALVVVALFTGADWLAGGSCLGSILIAGMLLLARIWYKG